MNALDVNVLLALHRPDHVFHRSATAWWDESSATGEPFMVADLVWVGFVRTATNRRLFEQAATFEAAWHFVDAVTGQPTYRPLIADRGALEHFERLGRQVNASGNVVTDAYIAGCAASYGATVVTFDRDFRKFDGLRVTELSA